ncbi:MAG: hypothetical protein ACFFGZ_07430 [Candidatus Thorarchaeota archaeon]
MASQLHENPSDAASLAQINEEEPQILKGCQKYSSEMWITLELRTIRKLCLSCEAGGCPTKKLL